MIKVILIALALVIVLGLIAVLPTIHIDVDTVIASNAFSYIRAALYFIPAGTCVSILTIILGLWIFRVIVSLVKVIWDLLPGG